MYQGRSEQYWQYAAVHYPAETKSFECPLETRVLHYVVKYRCHPHDTVNRIKILLKIQHYANLVSEFVAEHIIEGLLVCDVA